MGLRPKTVGAVGVAVSAAFLSFTWYTARATGRFSGFLFVFGVMVLPISLALVTLPTRLLLVPTEIDGRPEYDTRQPKFTALGAVLLIFGCVASVGVGLYLRRGF